MKPIIFILTFLFVGHNSISQDWVYIGTDVKGDKIWIKSKYVSKRGDYNNENIIKVWDKKKSKINTIIKNHKEVKVYNVEILTLCEYDCKEKRRKLITKTIYNSKGDVIDSFTIPDYLQDWTEIVPESVGETILENVCELFN